MLHNLVDPLVRNLHRLQEKRIYIKFEKKTKMSLSLVCAFALFVFCQFLLLVNETTRKKNCVAIHCLNLRIANRPR